MWLLYVTTITAFLLVTTTTGRATEDFKQDENLEDLMQEVNEQEVNELEKREAPANEVTEDTQGNKEVSDEPEIETFCLPGPVGPRGHQGVRGRNGRDGRDGHPGFDGFDGEVGQPGKDGKQGPPGPAGSPGNDAPERGTTGVTYVRWGRTVCNEETAKLIYKGMVGGSHHSHKGGGVNYLCLPENPEFDYVKKGAGGSRGYVYSSEYQTNDVDDKILDPLHDHDVPCAVCDVSNRGRYLMIPARMTCPDGWTEEYHGYLISEHYNHPRSSDFICLDHQPEARPNSNANKDGALLYMVEARCNGGGLPCDKYVDGNELTCVVCTK